MENDKLFLADAIHNMTPHITLPVRKSNLI